MARLRPVPETAPRALALIRVSKEREGMISPELQDTAIGDYCARAGYTITHRMEGLDESGSRARSRWWARLESAVGMVEDGQVDVIVVWKFSRTARNRLRWAVALDRVESAGGRLESATEQVDVSTSTGRFTRGMLAELNAFEAERIGEQWKETHARRRSNGLHHNGGHRHGYTYLPASKTWTPDPDTAPLVEAMFEQYVAGKGLYALAAWARSVGLPPRIPGTRWTQRGVRSFMDSGFPAGLLNVHDPACGCRQIGTCRRRLSLPGAHEPIIGRRLWEAYLAERARRRGTPAQLLTPRTPLAGLVRCGACGYAMHSMGAARLGYQCRNAFCAVKPSVRQHRAEALVRDWLRDYVADIQRAAELALSQSDSTAAANAKRTRLARQILKLDEELTRLTREYTRGVVPESAYVAARDELLAEKTAAEREHAQAAAAAQAQRPSPGTAGNLLAHWDTLPAADLNGVLRELLRVVVDRGEWRSAARVVPAWEWSPPSAHRPGAV